MGGPSAKRRKLNQSSNAPAEVVFDDESRADYLTGFHKRKVARAKEAQAIAARLAREEKIKDRAEMRKQRKQQLEEHVEAINAALRKAVGYENGESDTDEEAVGTGEWKGIEEPLPPVNHEDEYVDEDKYTTVAVETVGISKEGFVKLGGDSEEEEEADSTVEIKKPHGRGRDKAETQAYPVKKEKRKVVKKKKIKFKYEGKEERKVTRMKERSKNMLQAKARREGQSRK